MPLRVIPFRDRLLNRLLKKAPLADVEREAPLFRAGEAAGWALLVREGHVRLETASRQGDGAPGRTVDVAMPWELTGTAAMLPGGLHRWSAVAGDGGAVIQRLDGRAVRRVLRRAEGTFDAFWGAALDRLEVARAIGPGTSGAASRRLALLLVHLAERAADPTGPPPGPTLVLPLRLTHRVLGEMAGLHRSTVTTLLNDWLYRDLLRAADPGWTIPDRDALQAES